MRGAWQRSNLRSGGVGSRWFESALVGVPSSKALAYRDRSRDAQDWVDVNAPLKPIPCADGICDSASTEPPNYEAGSLAATRASWRLSRLHGLVN
jgi:hypothetical protein